MEGRTGADLTMLIKYVYTGEKRKPHVPWQTTMVYLPPTENPQLAKKLPKVPSQSAVTRAAPDLLFDNL